MLEQGVPVGGWCRTERLVGKLGVFGRTDVALARVFCLEARRIARACVHTESAHTESCAACADLGSGMHTLAEAIHNHLTALNSRGHDHARLALTGLCGQAKSDGLSQHTHLLQRH